MNTKCPLILSVWLALGTAATLAFADEKPSTLKVATWNLEWFFDDHQGDNFSDLSKKLSAPSRADW